MKDSLTFFEAYKAMFIFLDKHYDRKGAEALPSLLSDMSLLADDRPADPGVWQDWTDAIRATLETEVDIHQELK